jgi:hypothetical protein
MKTNAARAPIAKLDLYQINKADYATPRKPVLLRIAQATYLGIAGRGTPGGEAFQQAIGALYSVAFTIKMASKFAGRDYGVSKLEGLWWVDSGRSFMTEPKDEWSWRLLIRTPDFIGKREMEAARKQLAEKGKDPLFKEVELTTLNEDQCVQMRMPDPTTGSRRPSGRWKPSPPGKAAALTACTTRSTCPIRAAWLRKSCGPFCAFPSDK